MIETLLKLVEYRIYRCLYNNILVELDIICLTWITSFCLMIGLSVWCFCSLILFVEKYLLVDFEVSKLQNLV